MRQKAVTTMFTCLSLILMFSLLVTAGAECTSSLRTYVEPVDEGRALAATFILTSRFEDYIAISLSEGESCVRPGEEDSEEFSS